jgi:Ser/Thr protein kinase RdoA (MazF antagonist)
MDHGPPPVPVLQRAGMQILPGEIRPREGRAWLVDWQGTRGILRQAAVPADAASLVRLTDDVTWLHAFLARLADLGFPSPWPLPSFGGESWTIADGMLWEAVSFLPGEAVGWAAKPSMEEIGALLGHYHVAVRRIEVTGQRPGALPLADVPGILLSPRLEAARVSPDTVTVIRDLAAQLARDLSATRPLAGERVVIHGDFTNDNVIADGTPPRPAGVIDFALAHAETPLADIGYGLWRSGRPHEEADHLDLLRVRRFLRGYAGIAPISAAEARVIPVYLRGRGLQMIAKRVRAGRADTRMLAEVQWLTAHAAAVGDALAAAVS